MLVKFHSSINVCSLYRQKQRFCHSLGFNADVRGVKEDLRGFKSFGANANNATIRESIRFDEDSSFKGKTFLNLEIITNITELLLDLSDSIEISSTVEGIAAEEKELDKVTSNIPSCYV